MLHLINVTLNVTKISQMASLLLHSLAGSHKVTMAQSMHFAPQMLIDEADAMSSLSATA